MNASRAKMAALLLARGLFGAHGQVLQDGEPAHQFARMPAIQRRASAAENRISLEKGRADLSASILIHSAGQVEPKAL